MHLDRLAQQRLTTIQNIINEVNNSINNNTINYSNNTINYNNQDPESLFDENFCPVCQGELLTSKY